MAVRLVFLGKLADLAGCGEQVLDTAAPLGWDALLAALPAELSAAIEGDKVRVALDGTVLPDKRQLIAGEGAEIAFLPPVSGG